MSNKFCYHKSVFCYKSKQAAMALVITFSFHLHTYCNDFSGAGVATKMSPTQLKVLKLWKTIFCAKPILAASCRARTWVAIQKVIDNAVWN